MRQKLELKVPALRLPVCPGAAEYLLEVYADNGDKLLELQLPCADAAAFAVELHLPGQQCALEVAVELPEALTELFRARLLAANSPALSGVKGEGVSAPETGAAHTGVQREVMPGFQAYSAVPELLALHGQRPAFHFSARFGWINDPNGLVFDGEYYQLYFQHNPLNTAWQNMSWGHARSRDLLHWEQLPCVLFPDAEGTVFSGCALVDERGLVSPGGEALLYYYTAAGGTNGWSEGRAFTQRMALSTDGGMSLQKCEPAILPAICPENRDPKVFWHEASRAYVMVLWLEGNAFAILRSENLRDWKQSQRLELQDAWECPDLLCLNTEGAEAGETHWVFWSADGFYFPGSFDGYCFTPDGMRGEAYLNRLPYAAQSFSGVRDRNISVAWLRTPNEGRSFTGLMSIPMELGLRRSFGGWRLCQRPVREFYAALIPAALPPASDKGLLDFETAGECGRRLHYWRLSVSEALLADGGLLADVGGMCLWLDVTQSGQTGQAETASRSLRLGETSCALTAGGLSLELLLDGWLLEIFADGCQYGAFALPKSFAGRRVQFVQKGLAELTYSVLI